MNDAEAIKAVTLAAYYCSTEEGWGHFLAWMCAKDLLKGEEILTLSQMKDALGTMHSIIREIELQLLAVRLSEKLSGEDL